MPFPLLTFVGSSDTMGIGDREMDNITEEDTNSNELKYTSFHTEKKLQIHLKKHLHEYTEFSPEMYVQRAAELLNSVVDDKNILGFTGKEGFVFRYDVKENDFAIGHFGGSISTLYKPMNGVDEFLKERDADGQDRK